LWEENLRPLDRLQRYEWYYLNNPAGTGTTFLLHDGVEPGGIVGCTGVAPRVFHHHDQMLRALLSADFAVNKAHRTVKPAMLLQRAARDFGQRCGDFSYGFPNGSAVGVFLRIGYKQLGTLGRYAKVLRHESYLRRMVSIPGIAPVAGRLLDGATAIRDVLREQSRRPNLQFVWLQDFDARFDALWDESRAKYPVLGDRRASWLKWRFDRPSGTRCEIAAIVDRRTNAIRAYAVVAPKEEGIARIGDFLSASPEDLARLLGLLSRELRRRNYRSIWVYYVGAAWVHDVLTAEGFVLRDADRPLVVDPGRGIDPAIFLNRDNWYITAADTDT
jgi:hypothetical protein